MTAHHLARVLLALSFCATLAGVRALAGGWAVITLDELPEYVRPGEAFTIAYTVRQHGQHLVPGLTGRIEATAQGDRVVATARPGTYDGHYVATLTLPAAGRWSVTIAGGFGQLSTLTLPLLALEGARPEPMDPVTRGRQLFVAKGCATCHRVEGKTTSAATSYGPLIVPQKYQSEYLVRALANPSIIPAAANSPFRMPDLRLRATEIEALVAFINEPPRSTAARR